VRQSDLASVDVGGRRRFGFLLFLVGQLAERLLRLDLIILEN
jgi:hypothetical protein